MTKNELAKAMGYKGITARLTGCIREMLAENILTQEISGSHNRVKLTVRQ